MLRPIPGASQYRTHLDGLYMCGAGTHPGGGLTEFQEKCSSSYIGGCINMNRDLRFTAKNPFSL